MDAERAVVQMEAETLAQGNLRRKEEKPLKRARSEAELIALRQRQIQIVLTATNVLVSCLTCLKVFGIL